MLSSEQVRLLQTWLRHEQTTLEVESRRTEVELNVDTRTAQAYHAEAIHTVLAVRLADTVLDRLG